MSNELTYPERISMFVSMLRRSSDIESFERTFDEDLKTIETFRPVEKQCRLAIERWIAEIKIRLEKARRENDKKAVERYERMLGIRGENE